jgi:hypothetical protein
MGRTSNRLNICYDPGTSLSKILYRIGSRGKLKFLTMEAQTLTLPSSSASTLAKNHSTVRNSNSAWVRLSSDGDCHLIGFIAREFRSVAKIKKLKYESLVPKILAAVGAIATSEKLSTQLEVNLSLLLPMDEYTNRHELELNLTQAAKSFWFQDCHYEVNFTQLNCEIEGFGITLADLASCGVGQFQSQRLVYLMFGYRNTSLLFFENGTLSTSVGF